MRNGFGYRDEHRPSFVLALVGVIALALSFGCATGPVTTSTGAVVPAATVQSQDNVADVLHMVRESHRQYVALYEATKTTMDPVTRAKQYQTLNDLANGLDASQAALITWKQVNAGASPGTILRPILATAPAFLDLAVRAKLLTQAQADMVKGILAGIPVVSGEPAFSTPWNPLAPTYRFVRSADFLTAGCYRGERYVYVCNFGGAM